MKKALAPVAALLFSVSILLTGQGLMGTLLPVRASIEAFSTVSIGIFGAGYFLGFAIGCLRGGELVQRVGHSIAARPGRGPFCLELAAASERVLSRRTLRGDRKLVERVCDQRYRWLVQRAPSEHPVPFAEALAATQTASPVYEDEIAHDSRARRETTHGLLGRHESNSHAGSSGMSFLSGQKEKRQ
ncbi:MAG: hypothetical protein OEM64_12340 [Gammaproteobacteria bacterium]|nr:hypothetical protein [Gammaproteobacteria bacterium]